MKSFFFLYPSSLCVYVLKKPNISNAVTYVDVFRQHLVRKPVLVEDVVVYGSTGSDGTGEEAEDSVAGKKMSATIL